MNSKNVLHRVQLFILAALLTVALTGIANAQASLWTNLSVPYAVVPPNITGGQIIPGQWGGAPSFTMTPTNMTSQGTMVCAGWSDVNDNFTMPASFCSGAWYLAWDANYLYIAAAVQEQYALQGVLYTVAANGSSGYNGTTGLQFQLDLTNSTSSGLCNAEFAGPGTGFFYIDLCPGTSDTTTGQLIPTPQYFDHFESTLPNIQLGSSWPAGGFNMLAALKWSDLAQAGNVPAGFTFKPGVGVQMRYIAEIQNPGYLQSVGGPPVSQGQPGFSDYEWFNAGGTAAGFAADGTAVPSWTPVSWNTLTLSGTNVPVTLSHFDVE